MRHLIAFALAAFPVLASAQQGTISPGMTRARVVAALGEPVTARDTKEFTYLFYRNDCGRACGMNDLVVLRGDSVVDAIFRSASRHYTGTSSSPEAITHGAARTRPGRRSRAPLAATGTSAPVPARPAKVEPPKPAPAKVEPTKPAPAKVEPTKPAAVKVEPPKPAPAKAEPAKKIPAKSGPAITPKSPTSAPSPSSPLKPSSPNDTRPSIPAGEPPVKKPAAATSVKPSTP